MRVKCTPKKQFFPRANKFFSSTLTCKRAWQWWHTKQCNSSRHWAAGSVYGSVRARHVCIFGSKARRSRWGGKGGPGPNTPKPQSQWAKQTRKEKKKKNYKPLWSFHAASVLHFSIKGFCLIQSAYKWMAFSACLDHWEVDHLGCG